MNGDGNGDVIIGAPFNDNGGTNAGRAYIYYGGTSTIGVVNYTNSATIINGTVSAGSHTDTQAVGGNSHDIIEEDMSVGSGNSTVVDVAGDETVTEGVNLAGSDYTDTQTDNNVYQNMSETNRDVDDTNYVDSHSETLGYTENFINAQSATDSGAYATLNEEKFIVPDVEIFNETFPTVTAPWDGTGQDESWNVITVSEAADISISSGDATGSAVSGDPVLRMEDCDDPWGTGDIVWASVNLSGYENVVIEYYWQLDGVDAGEGFRSAYSTDATGGLDSEGTWNQMYEHLDAPEEVWTKDTFELPGSACVANFKFRFNAYGTGPGEESFIDDVKITGNYTIYKMDIEFNTTNVVAADNYYLQLNYSVDGSETDFGVLVYNSTSAGWDDLGWQGDLTSTSFTTKEYTLNSSHRIGTGWVRIRFIGRNETDDTTNSTLYIEYHRIRSYTPPGYSLNVIYTLDNFPTDRDNYQVRFYACTNRSSGGESFTVQWRESDGNPDWNNLDTGSISGTSETQLSEVLAITPDSNIEIRITDDNDGATPLNTTLRIDLVELYCWNDTRYDVDLYYAFTFSPVPTDYFNVSVYSYFNDGIDEPLSIWAWDYDEATPAFEDTGVDVNSGASYGWTNVTNLGNEYISSSGEVKIRFKADTVTGDDTNAGTLSIDYLDVRNDTMSYGGHQYLNVNLTGETDNNNFGWSVSNLSDINNALNDDVIVGAPGYSSNTGRAYIFYGNDSVSDNIDASDANITLNGATSGDKFGFSVHYAGDINGDGDPDLIIGAPYNDSADGTKADCGAFYVYCGGSDIDSIANFTKYGEYAGDHFGWSVSFAGDIDNDNINETLCGAPHYNTLASENPPSAEDIGKAYVHVIPEFSDALIPVVGLIGIFISFRKKRKIIGGVRGGESSIQRTDGNSFDCTLKKSDGIISNR